MLGRVYYAEEKNHKELIRCISGSFVLANLKFSGCETVGDFWDWQGEGNSLCIRYWDRVPTEDERKNTEWKEYCLIKDKKHNGRISENEFEKLKNEFCLEQKHLDNKSARLSELWENQDSSIQVMKFRD